MQAPKNATLCNTVKKRSAGKSCLKRAVRQTQHSLWPCHCMWQHNPKCGLFVKQRFVLSPPARHRLGLSPGAKRRFSPSATSVCQTLL